MNSYLIVSPVRAGSSWLNTVFETHYKLYNVGETLCKISSAFVADDNEVISDDKNKYYFHYASEQYKQNMVNMWSEDIRKLSREEQLNFIKSKGPCVAKFTPWDLYPDMNRGPGYGYGYSLDELKEKWKPLKTIFLYRRNIVEHFLSFLAYHRTGIGNATSQFMQYQRPREPFDDDWTKYYANHFWIMNKCYEDHNFDYTVAYEDLFNMDELCGIPLKDYHGQFTFKLNKYTREEKDEVIRRTGYSENYELC